MNNPSLSSAASAENESGMPAPSFEQVRVPSGAGEVVRVGAQQRLAVLQGAANRIGLDGVFASFNPNPNTYSTTSTTAGVNPLDMGAVSARRLVERPSADLIDEPQLGYAQYDGVPIYDNGQQPEPAIAPMRPAAVTEVAPWDIPREAGMMDPSASVYAKPKVVTYAERLAGDAESPMVHDGAPDAGSVDAWQQASVDMADEARAKIYGLAA